MSKYNLIKLTNGLTVVLQRDSRVRSVSISVGVRAGSYYETKETAGLAHFLEHMLFEGTKLYPTARILAEQIESGGGYSSAYTDRGYVIYGVKVFEKHLKRAFNYLSQVIFYSTLETKAIEKEKGIVTEEIKQTMDDPQRVIWEDWMQWIWGADQPLGRSILGEKKTVQKITSEKLKKYLQNLYIPQNIILAVVGNFSLSEAKEYVQKYFDVKMKKQVQIGQQSVLCRHKMRTNVIKTNTQQVQLLCGFVTGVSHSHKDRFAMRLLAEILSGGVSARIFQKLIYELGIAYSAGSYEMELKDTGIFFVSGGFGKENIEKAIRTIIDELKDLQINGVSAQELVSAKERSVAKLFFSAEKPEEISNLYVTQFMTEGRIIPIEDLVVQINNVSVDDIGRVVSKYLNNSNLYIMLRGNMQQDCVKIVDRIRQSL